MKLTIGERIRNYRKELGMTQNEFASQLSVTKVAVSKWENSETYPNISLLPSIADLFDTTVDDLLRGKKQNDSETI